MTELPKQIAGLSEKHGFTRSAKYDQAWMFDHSMGPNPLWLTEWLTRDMRLSKDHVVLDMGCGKAITSIFLAREFGCTVFANDLWIAPEDNLKRITEQSLQGSVFPIRAEAHALPYAKGQFDAIISVDAYQYFGTDDLYLEYFVQFLKPGGQFGVVVPGWSRERTDAPPEFAGFHTGDWWRKHLVDSGLVELERCDYLPDGNAVWRDSARGLWESKRVLRAGDGTSPDEMKRELDFWHNEVDLLENDKEGHFNLIRLIARRKSG